MVCRGSASVHRRARHRWVHHDDGVPTSQTNGHAPFNGLEIREKARGPVSPEKRLAFAQRNDTVTAYFERARGQMVNYD